MLQIFRAILLLLLVVGMYLIKVIGQMCFVKIFSLKFNKTLRKTFVLESLF